MTRLFLLFQALTIGTGGGLFAQKTLHRELKWAPSPATEVKAGQAQAPAVAPSFERAFIDHERGDLPYYHESIDMAAGTGQCAATLENAVFAPMAGPEAAFFPALSKLGPEPELITHLSFYRKQPVALVDILPFRRNSTTGRVEKLVSFDLLLVGTKRDYNLHPSYLKSYPDHSKLASGHWYRFSVAQDGVYKIDRQFLIDLGVDVSSLSSDLINLYGNHFGQLPYVNSESGTLPTDLVQNAIWVEDGGDGQFDANDYILFYATGPHRWELDQQTDLFHHVKNVYSDSADYFIGIDVDPPKRIQDVPLVTDPATQTVTTFNDRQFIERDLVNLIKSGREFLAETFDIVDAYNYSFDVPYLRSDAPVKLLTCMAARTTGSNSSSFNVSVAGGGSSTMTITGVGNGFIGAYAKLLCDTLTFNSSQSSLPVTITFDPYDPITSIGWTNYLEENSRRDLTFIGNQLGFRDLVSVGTGNISEFTLDQANNIHRIWEITDPTTAGNIPYADNITEKSFRLHTDSLRQFIAFRNGNFLTPTPIGRLANQDLHGTALPMDLVIVCPPVFLGEAQRLAERRTTEGLTVTIVTPQQVFNEFSCGSRDATAIKRYMRLLYDRAGLDPLMMPRYLLLFGDGSYNNISLAGSNQNYVPSYQTANSSDLSKSYTSDDYFGLLDYNEGEYSGDLVDIGIGRLPVSSQEQARETVDKILGYDRLLLTSQSQQNCNSTGDGGANDWRSWVLFASDDQEGESLEGIIHMDQSNQLATRVDTEHAEYNVAKIYLDAYQQFSTPGGERYPEAEIDLRDRVQKGTLVVNYVGHGGEVGWAHERFLDNSTILDWTNIDRLPLFMTATCEFSRWDDPARTSAGEYVLLNPNGGGIGLMTTTRLAYSQQNFSLSQYFYDHVFDTEDEQGRTQRFGDIYRRTKRDISTAQGGQLNHRNFALLGDPSTRLAIPRWHITTTAITDTLGNPMDTLKALSTVRVSGLITDDNGQTLTDLNGIVIPTVFDKRVSLSTLANDGGNPYPFSVRKNIIYRGKATVSNGAFHFTFVVPKDIAYQVGPGRISYYAEGTGTDGLTNAIGFTNDPLIGGTALDVLADEQGPQINLFMNDDRFVHGGITNEDPLLFAKLFDQNGMNTLGNSIGHDMLAVLDENTDQAVVLNDLYEADLDTYQSGQVRYRYSDLTEGSHTLSLKAWDVFNNSSTASTEFVVASSEGLALEHVLNYPNPFTTHTEFYFEHNRPCTTLEVQVQVFTVSGRLVKTISRRLDCEGFRTEPMGWDGLDDAGDKLGRGVYVYRVHVTAPDGEDAEKFDKLVILR